MEQLAMFNLPLGTHLSVGEFVFLVKIPWQRNRALRIKKSAVKGIGP
jgi:hypothetical protein